MILVIPHRICCFLYLRIILGKPVGSVRIDQAFASLVKGRLAKVVERVPLLAEEGDWAKSTAWEMAQGDFQYYKCAFGTKEGTFNQFKMKIPELPWNGEEPAAFVNKKHMQFTRYILALSCHPTKNLCLPAYSQTMSSLFDAQLEGDDGIFSILDAQLDQLKKTEPEKQVVSFHFSHSNRFYVNTNRRTIWYYPVDLEARRISNLR